MGKKNRKQKDLKLKDLQGLSKKEYEEGLEEIIKTPRGIRSVQASLHISRFLYDLVEDISVPHNNKTVDLIVEEYYVYAKDIITELLLNDCNNEDIQCFTSWDYYDKNWKITYTDTGKIKRHQFDKSKIKIVVDQDLLDKVITSSIKKNLFKN